jgi:hypothetical protein
MEIGKEEKETIRIEPVEDPVKRPAPAPPAPGKVPVPQKA